MPLQSALATIKGNLLAKPNYQFEKRQRDLAKKSKQEEKRQQKLAKKRLMRAIPPPKLLMQPPPARPRRTPDFAAPFMAPRRKTSALKPFTHPRADDLSACFFVSAECFASSHAQPFRKLCP
ncbi:MAG: hypothetical protein IPP59_04185 [Betaproteobacteria bacterium]|nr:hypothetical protein [Candidatus Dechloromonas phosphorivorans]